MTTSSELLAIVADLIRRRYADRVAVVVNAPNEICVHQSGNSKIKVSIRFVGTEFPVHVSLRYEPGSAKSVVEANEDAVFMWGDEKLTAEGFVYRAFKGWFGGYQRYE